MSLFSSTEQTSLKPLGAGDLIDRAVRFYRKNFWTFVLIAAPPVILGTIISVGWTVVGRQIFTIGRSADDTELAFYYLFLRFGNGLIWISETIATLVVMGGASRNFVRHILFSEPITFRETYKNVWSRLPGLLVASTILVLTLGFIGLILFYLCLLIAGVLVIGVYYLFAELPTIAAILSILISVLAISGVSSIFFLLSSRFAYIPQVMLVEGQGVFQALARSATLSNGNFKRFSALFIFTTVAAYSALTIVYIPLAWYAWANGVEIMAFNMEMVPAWYEIATQLISQGSFILLSPVWMVGLCLLYVDDRVRHEGYDIELMAARKLGEIPSVPVTYINPLQPALATDDSKPSPPPTARGGVLGLE